MRENDKNFYLHYRLPSKMKIELTEDKLVVKFDPLEEIAGIKRELIIPISSIKDIKPFKEADVKLTLRLGGTSLYKIDYGRFETSKGWAFVATEHLDKSTVLFLKDFNYDLVILDLDDKIVEEIKRRILGT